MKKNIQENFLSRCKISPKKLLKIYFEYVKECELKEEPITFAGISKRCNVHRQFWVHNQYKNECMWDAINFIRLDIYERIEKRCLSKKREYNQQLITLYLKSYGYHEQIDINQTTHIQKDDIDNLTDEELDNKINLILEKRIKEKQIRDNEKQKKYIKNKRKKDKK